MADRMFAGESDLGGGRPGTATRDVGPRNGGPLPGPAGPAPDGIEAALPVLRRLGERVERNMRLLDRLRVDPLAGAPPGLSDLIDVARRLRHDTDSLLMLVGEDAGLRRGGPRTLGAVLDEAVDATAEPMRVDVRSGPGASIQPAAATELLHVVAEVVDHITAVHPSGRLEVSCRTEAPGGVVVEIRADGATRHDPDEWRGRGLSAAARLAQRSRSGIVLRTPAPGHGAVSRGLLASIHCPGTVVKVDEPVYPLPLAEPVGDAPGYADLPAPSNGGRGIGSLEGGLGGLGDRPFSRILDELGSTPSRSPLPPAAEPGRPGYSGFDPGRPARPGAARPDADRPDPDRAEPGRPGSGGARAGRPELGPADPDRPDPDYAELGRPGSGGPHADRPEPDRPEPDRAEPDRPELGRPELGRAEFGRTGLGEPQADRPDPDPDRAELGRPGFRSPRPGRPEDRGGAEPGRAGPDRPGIGGPADGGPDDGGAASGAENGGRENSATDHGSGTGEALGVVGRPAPPLPGRRPDTRRPDPRRPDMRRPDSLRPDPSAPDQQRLDQQRPDQQRLDQLRPDQQRLDQLRPDQLRPDQQRPDQQRRAPRRPDPLSDPLPGLPAGSGPRPGPSARGADLDPGRLGADPAQAPGPADGAADAPSRRRSAWDSYTATGPREPAVDEAAPVASPHPVDELFGPIVDLGPLSDDAAGTPIFEAVASAWFRDEAAPRPPSPAARHNGHARPDPLDWESPGDPEWRAAAERAAQDDPSPMTPGGLPRRRPGGRLVLPRAAGDGAPPPVERVPDRVRERLSGYQRGLRQGRHRAEPGQPADPGDPAAW